MRYVLAATVIVVVAIALGLHLRPSRPPLVRPTFSSSSATAGPAQNADVLPGTPAPFVGDAPWALSALPECFRQVARRSGLPAFARRGFPAGALPVRPGSRLSVADCDVVVGAGAILVRRGADRLRIPPAARLFRVPGGFILDRRSRNGEDVRTYVFVRAK